MLTIASPVRPADKRHLAEKKNKLADILKKYLKCGTDSNVASIAVGATVDRTHISYH